MRLDDLLSRPPEVMQFLQHHHDLFLRWHQGHYTNKPVPPVAPGDLDRTIYGLDALLRPHTLHGYHCTRLTEAEIADIRAHGMQPPNLEQLQARINAVHAAGLIDAATAERLKAENGAAETYRAGMIWFCFYPPRNVDQGASERLFRNWGGEALYAYHETDPITGLGLRSIGTPCPVEADVPIATFGSGLSIKVIRRFLIVRGLQTTEPLEHDDNAKEPTPAANIVVLSHFLRRVSSN
jgi:hypothetical protein